MHRTSIKLYLTLCFIVPTLIAAAQAADTLKVDLTRTEGTRPFHKLVFTYLTEIEASADEVCGMLPMIKGDFQLWELELDHRRRMYERVMSGEVSEKEIAQHGALDGSNVYEGQIKHTVKILSGIHNGIKYVIVDSDNDDCFSNNAVYEFPLNGKSYEQWMDDAPVFLLNYERFDGVRVLKEDVLMKLLPFGRNRNERETMVPSFYQHYSGTIHTDGGSMDIALSTNPFEGHFDHVIIVTAQRGERFQNVLDFNTNIPYWIGDLIIVGKEAYRIAGVEGYGEKLILIRVELEDGKVVGVREGEYIAPMELTDLEGVAHAIPDREKHTFVYFWGTWCGPCVKKRPQLESLLAELKSSGAKVNFVSVAKERDILKLEEYVKGNGILWPVVFEDHYPQLLEDPETSDQTASHAFRPKSFPVYIVVDSYGKIVVREGSSGFKRVRDYLLK